MPDIGRQGKAPPLDKYFPKPGEYRIAWKKGKRFTVRSFPLDPAATMISLLPHAEPADGPTGAGLNRCIVERDGIYDSFRGGCRKTLSNLPRLAVRSMQSSAPKSDKISRMETKVLYSEDPAFVLSRAGVFLSSQPVLHNMILSILKARVAEGDPGHYWMAIQREEIVGVAVQSPRTFPATLTPMELPVAAAMADAIADAGIALPGVNGEAATAATFAGQWSERTKSAAVPFQGNRLYELLETSEVPDVEGRLRQASPQERSLMILWSRAFQHEIGESAEDTELRVDRGLAAGQLWLWDLGGEAVSMAIGREPLLGVVRLSGVYTTPEKRKHGYAAACVHALSKKLRDAGSRCILYTDLGNTASNSIYRRIGYRALAEVLRYRFE